jgi:hypothetical protein
MASDDIWKYYTFAAKAAADVFGTILVPAIVAVILKFVFSLSNPVFYLLLALAFILSGLALYRKIKQYGRSYQQLTEDELRSPRG